MSLPVTLPEGWGTSRLDRIATINARIGWKALTAQEYQSEGFAFLATPNIKNSEIDFEQVNYISQFRYDESPELRLREGDVLLAKDGNTLGIVNIVKYLPCAATVNGSIAVIRPFGVESRYLRYVISGDHIQKDIQLVKGGMGVPHLFQRDIKRFPIPLPPVDEQFRIANFLDEEIARIDRLADLRGRQMTLLDGRYEAAISELVAPGISEPSQAKGVWPWLPELPESRKLVRLGYLCRLQNGLTVDGQRKLDGDVVTRPYLRVANVQAGRLDLDEVSEVTVPRAVAARTTLRAGDVLMTEGGDIDKLGRGAVWDGEIFDCLHQNHIFAIRPDKSLLDARYLSLMTETVHGRCYFESTGSKTTNLASTNSSKILAFPIPLPPLVDQQELAGQAERVRQATVRAKSLLKRQVDVLAERRQALITAAVTGQFDVSTASGRNVTEGISV
ncbi:Type-1 restriction enzyme EcoKI specificity protein [Streptomyces sp. enrichment culture]|uniref:restriction endonuclease subunit S n=1 Tax=Streptomyces sp. enrichment culture TaxID=1795815 RepID=UPI003F54B0C4